MEVEVIEGKRSEIWKEITDPNHGYLVVGVSAVLFFVLSQFVKSWAPPVDAKSEWRWKNVAVSLVHSVVSGSWAVLCFYERPEMSEDLITVYSQFSHTLVSFSVGYFLFDVLDLLYNQRTRQSYELLSHHAVIITCFMVAVWSRHYIGYAVVALLVEWNSIFLHLRQLLQIYGVTKLNPWYRLNSLTNLATFITFRIMLLAWMTRWIVINKDAVPLVFYVLGSVGLAIIVSMNVVLFYRLLQSDFISLKDGGSDYRKGNKLTTSYEK